MLFWHYYCNTQRCVLLLNNFPYRDHSDLNEFKFQQIYSNSCNTEPNIGVIAYKTSFLFPKTWLYDSFDSKLYQSSSPFRLLTANDFHCVHASYHSTCSQKRTTLHHSTSSPRMTFTSYTLSYHSTCSQNKSVSMQAQMSVGCQFISSNTKL